MTHQSPAAVASKSTHASEVESITEPTQQMIYQIAGQIILVEAQDTWTAKVIEELFAGWYLTPDTANRRGLLSPAIVIKNSDKPPEIPRHWPQFEVSGGICFTSGKTSYIDIEGSIIAVEKPKVGVHVWTKGRLGTQSPSLTRVVTYALAAALRRRCLFELHSGAVIDPESGRGVLIIGPSGSGKSTLTVQLATAGWSFLTDDVLLLSSEGAEVKSWPMRRCFAITSETFTASNFLQARASIDYIPAQRKNKKQFVPHGVFNSEFKEQCIPQRLFFTEVSGTERSHVVQLSSTETMARLISMNPWCCYDRATATEHLAVLSALVKQSTGYCLLAGKDLLDPGTSANVMARYTRN